MRSRRMIEAYDSIQPPQATYDEILSRVCMSEKKKRHPLRTGLLIAACVALVGALSAGGYAAYRKWSLPEPETYQNTEHGYQDVHSTQEYEPENIPEPAQTEPLTDDYFIAKAAELLHTLGKDDVDTGALTVTRSNDQIWDREEVAVTFTESENYAEITFAAPTGELLRLTDIDWVEEGTEAAADPEALARNYYAKLPVPQGYELTYWTSYDEQYYSFDFCREVMEGLYNEYEMVRIGVNPASGRLCGVNVFNVPLLDDHEPGDVPLTQAQAEEIAQKTEKLDGYVLQSAEMRVTLPNYFYSDTAFPENGGLRYSKVARLAWVLTYDGPSEEFDDLKLFYIDYYTGELLGGDMT